MLGVRESFLRDRINIGLSSFLLIGLIVLASAGPTMPSQAPSIQLQIRWAGVYPVLPHVAYGFPLQPLPAKRYLVLAIVMRNNTPFAVDASVHQFAVKMNIGTSIQDFYVSLPKASDVPRCDSPFELRAGVTMSCALIFQIPVGSSHGVLTYSRELLDKAPIHMPFRLRDVVSDMLGGIQFALVDGEPFLVQTGDWPRRTAEQNGL